MFPGFRTALLALFVGLLALGGISAQDTELVDQTLLMTFRPDIQFSPVYVAIEKGYFAEAGANVTVEYLDEPDVANAVADNQTQFGVVGGGQVILARSAGRPIVFVYEWFQKYPVGVVTPADSGIESVADLKGRKVGIPGRFGESYSGIVALLSANELSEEDIQLETIGFTAPENVCVGFDTHYAQGVEASVVYINNEPLQIEQRCTPVRVFPVSDAVDLLSNGLITNEETIDSDPDFVRAMVGAFDAGLRSVIDNPAEAYLLSKAHVETLPLEDDLKAALEDAAADQSEFLATDPDREEIAASREALWEALSQELDASLLVDFRVLLNTIELWDADRLGVTDPASWEATQATLIQMGFLAEPLADLQAAFTNDFLPEVEDE